MGATPEIRRFSPHQDMSLVVAEVRANGVAIIEDLFTPSIADSLAASVAPDLVTQAPGGGDFFGNRKRSVSAIFARGAQFSEHLLLEERLLEVADGILLPAHPMAAAAISAAPAPPGEADFFRRFDPLQGPNCDHYRLNATVAMQVCRGGGNQPLHRDEWRYLPYLHRDPQGPEFSVAFMLALSEFSTANGATRYVPGSNRWPASRQPREREVVQAVMGKGSVAVWLGSAYHGLGINHTEEPRTGIIFSYVVDYMTQEENQFMAVPPKIAFALPKRAQQLIGYRSSTALNYIEGIDGNHVLTVAASDAPDDQEA